MGGGGGEVDIERNVPRKLRPTVQGVSKATETVSVRDAINTHNVSLAFE